jgi:hypothetical protein
VEGGICTVMTSTVSRPYARNRYLISIGARHRRGRSGRARRERTASWLAQVYAAQFIDSLEAVCPARPSI